MICIFNDFNSVYCTMYPAYTVVLYVVYEYLKRKCLQPAYCAPIPPINIPCILQCCMLYKNTSKGSVCSLPNVHPIPPINIPCILQCCMLYMNTSKGSVCSLPTVPLYLLSIYPVYCSVVCCIRIPQKEVFAACLLCPYISIHYVDKSIRGSQQAGRVQR